MKTLALKPPKPTLTAPRKKTERRTCTSCDGPLNETDECRGCSQ